MAATMVMERSVAYPPENPPTISSPWTCAILAQCLSLSDGPHLEIGTKFGATALLASIFTTHRITCVDPMEHLTGGWFPAGYIGHIGTWTDNIKSWDLEDRVSLVVAMSHPLPVTGPFATAYIDGDHTYYAALQDFTSVRNITTDFIIWDDLEKDTVYEAFMTALRVSPQWRAAFMCYTTGVMVNKEREGDWDLALRLGSATMVAGVTERRPKGEADAAI